MELYKKYRPTKLSQIVGQLQAVTMLKKLGKSFPHFLLLHGPSGVGKTTIARICRSKLKCSDIDFSEVNVALDRGIEMVKTIESVIDLQPMAGPVRLWICDEVHQITPAAQGAFLKILEDPPPWAYFIWCTTDPQKLKPTIKTRATSIKLNPVGVKDLQDLIHQVAEQETGVGFSEEVSEQIAELSQGSPRKALVLLDQVLWLDSPDEMINALGVIDTSSEAIELCRLLLKPKPSWSDICKVIKSIDGFDDQIESIRHLILSYMSSVALKGGKVNSALDIIDCFKEPFYESKKAGFLLACYDAIGGRS